MSHPLADMSGSQVGAAADIQIKPTGQTASLRTDEGQRACGALPLFMLRTVRTA